MLKHSFALLAFMSLLSFVARAQTKIHLRILDTEKNNLSGVTVDLSAQSRSTDGSGEVQFTNLKQDRTYTVKIHHLGYETVQQNLRPSDDIIVIALSPSIRQTGEVFVTGTRAKANSATTFKNITKEELRKTNLGQDIPFLLDQTPGVVIGSDAGAGIGYTNMTIRGADNQRVNVTLNGIPLNDAESMGSFFVNLPDFASSVESIQIQRGIGTSTNGAGAFGASLNIQTDVLETKPYAELNNTFGSYNSWKNTVKVGSGLINDKYAFNARLSRITSDGYVERAKSNMKSFYLDGGIYTDKHILKATVFGGDQTTYQAWYGTPEPLITGDASKLPEYADALGLYDGPERDRLLNADRRYNYYNYKDQTDNYKQTHAHLQYTFDANEKFSLSTALHYTKGAGYFEEFRPDDDFSTYDMTPITAGTETITSTDLVRRRWLDNHFYGLTYSAHYNPSADLKFTFGGGYNEYVGDHFGEVIWARYASQLNIADKYYLNDAKKTDFNIYGKMDYRWENILLNVDLQYRNIHYRGKGPNDEFLADGSRQILDFRDKLNFFNPKAGLTYFVSNNTNIYTSYAYASKEPVRKDYVENPLNEFPRPEKMHDIEAGVRHRDQHINIGLNGYAMLYQDQLIATGQLNDVGGTIRQNVPDSYRIGVEFDGAWNISEKWSWKATAAFSSNKIKNFSEYVTVYNDDWDVVGQEEIKYDKTNIAMSASTILSNDFTYRPVQPIALSLTSKYVSRLYLDNTGTEERSIDPSFVNNFRVLYTFQALGLQRVDLNLAVNNILNTKYQTNGYTWGSMDSSKQRTFYNFYYPQAGTNFLLGLNIRF